jgi:hypothetical protein
MPDFFLISGLFLVRVIDRDWRTYLDRKAVHLAYFRLLLTGPPTTSSSTDWCAARLCASLFWPALDWPNEASFARNDPAGGAAALIRPGRCRPGAGGDPRAGAVADRVLRC